MEHNNWVNSFLITSYVINGLFLEKCTLYNYKLGKDVYFMKMLMKLALMGTAFGLAANYSKPMLNRRTKKKVRKQAKMFQGVVVNLFDNLVGALR